MGTRTKKIVQTDGWVLSVTEHPRKDAAKTYTIGCGRGSAFVVISDNRDAPALLMRLSVDKGDRGRGIGSALLHRCEILCADHGVACLAMGRKSNILGRMWLMRRGYSNQQFDGLGWTFAKNLAGSYGCQSASGLLCGAT